MTPQTLQDWLRDDALPVWADHGVDRVQGGFFELLNQDGTPVERARRARLVARQIYVFSLGPAVGWTGDAIGLVTDGLDYLQRHLLSADPCRVISAVEAQTGAITAKGPDLYDDAFVLFALASVIQAFGPRPDLEDLARRLVTQIELDRGTADGAFCDIGQPLQANPLMHLTEAFLAWQETVPDADRFWQSRTEKLINLCRTKMIKPDLCALPEVYNADWTVKPDDKGVLIEPGHQFEWGWLMARWAAMVGDDTCLADAMGIARAAEDYGVAADGIVFEAVDGQKTPAIAAPGCGHKPSGQSFGMRWRIIR